MCKTGGNLSYQITTTVQLLMGSVTELRLLGVFTK